MSSTVIYRQCVSQAYILRPLLSLLSGCYDALSAKVMERAGHDTAFVSGCAVSTVIGMRLWHGRSPPPPQCVGAADRRRVLHPPHVSLPHARLLHALCSRSAGRYPGSRGGWDTLLSHGQYHPTVPTSSAYNSNCVPFPVFFSRPAFRFVLGLPKPPVIPYAGCPVLSALSG